MPFITLALLVGLGAAVIALWRPPRLPRGWMLLVIAAVPHLLSLYGSYSISLFLASAVLLGGWCWVNRAIPGITIIGAGIGLNLFVMALHGGRMPVDAGILAPLGYAAEPGTLLSYSKDIVIQDSPFWLLSDWIVLPIGQRVIIASPGDAVIGLGIVWWLVRSHTPEKEPRDAATNIRTAPPHAARPQ